jgi:5,6-dimethylbenzimidazole synthase
MNAPPWQARAFETDGFARDLDQQLEAPIPAPSVGLSQRRRLLRVQSPARRAAVQRAFETCNAAPAARYADDRAIQYAVRKLAGLGVGWIAILRPRIVADILEVPPGWRLVADLAIGWPCAPADEPELARAGWESRRSLDAVLEDR